MLSAFSYSDTIYKNEMDSNPIVWNKEKELINKNIDILAEKSKNMGKDGRCPLCNSRGIPLFTKNKFIYYQCTKCKSVFLSVEQELINEYKEANDIAQFRKTEVYQEDAYQKRGQQWRELFDWLKFRTYRYMGKNKGLEIIDYNNRFDRFGKMLLETGMCNHYYIYNSNNQDKLVSENADLLLYMACMQQTLDPVSELKRLYKNIKKNGLLFLSSRLGTGFDVLTLGSETDRIFPFEHVLLPSIKGIELVLQEAGFKILEIITPGNLDISIVLKNRDKIHQDNFFLRYLFEECNVNTLNEFQRFLQKNRLSSYVQIIAKKE